jgi:hypothetical protein
MRSKTWKNNEIEILKNKFLEGKSIKEISKEMGRTPTALNKAVSRFGIRQSRSYKPKSTSRNSIDNLFTNSDKIIFKSKVREENKWVDINKVVNYLHKKGIFVNKNDIDTKDLYFLDSKPLLASQLVLKANRLRVEENKKIFLVDGITW